MPIDLSNIADYNPRQIIVRNEMSFSVSIGDIRVILNAKNLPGSTIDLIKLNSFNKKPFRTFTEISNSRDLELLVKLGKITIKTELGVLSIAQGIKSTDVGSLLNTITSGATTHSELIGLLNDDHTQYYNQIRGDTRYLRRSQNLLDLEDIALAIENLGRGDPFGLASLDSTGKVPLSELPSITSGLNFKGLWNASINSPILTSGVGTSGDFYIVSVAGSTTLDGISTWNVKDYVIFVTTQWFRIISTDLVSSVFARTGVVSAVSGDYTATQITNIPAGNITSTNVQSALNELDGFISLKPDTFLELGDTPSVYTGYANRLVKVNSAANALSFASYLYADDTNSRLGIGQTSPVSLLHIGEAAGSSGLFVPGGPILPVPKDFLNVASNVSTGSTYGITSASIMKMTVDDSDGIGIANINCAVSTIGFGSSISQLIGNFSKAEVAGDGDVSSALGYYSLVYNSSLSTLTNAYGFFSYIEDASFGGQITNSYGFYFLGSAGNITNRYGIFIASDPNFLEKQLRIGGFTSFTFESSAILDIVSTSQGVLFPRMSSAAVSSIFSPAESLFVYNITDSKFQYYSIGTFRDLSYNASHSQLIDLTSDDHSIYPYILGRSGGQILRGGIADDENLTLRSTFSNTTGNVKIEGGFEVNVTSGTFLKQLSILQISDTTNYVDIQGNYAFVVSADKLDVVDITEKNSPTLISTTTFPSSGGIHLHVVGEYAYIVVGSSDFLIYNISNPKSPVLISTTSLSGTPWHIYVSGNYAYITGLTGDYLKIIYIGDPINPYVTDTITLTGGAGLSLYVQDNYVYVTSIDDDTLYIVDISDPFSASLVSTLTTGTRPTDIEVRGRYAYIGLDTGQAIQIVDISNVAIPVIVSTTSVLYNVVRIYLSGKYLYIAYNLLTIFDIYDISNPSSPSLVISTSAPYDVRSIDVVGNYAVLATYDSSNSNGYVEIYDIHGAELSSLFAHSISAGDAIFDKTVRVNNQLDVGTDLIVGSGGILSGGNIASSTNTGSNYFGAPILNKTTTEAQIKNIIGTRTDISHINYDAGTDKVYLYRYNGVDYKKIELGSGPGTTF